MQIRAVLTLGLFASSLPLFAAMGQDRAKERSGADSPLVGVWEGTLEVGVARLRLAICITEGPDRSLVGKLDSPDQGAKGIPIDSIAIQGKTVRLGVKTLMAVISGDLSADGEAVVGKLDQGGLSMRLELKRATHPAAPRRPQEPKAPLPYLVEDVSYENPVASIRLSGTLTRPRADRPGPAVLLVSGSGPQDRDESGNGHRPYLVLADHLTRRGVAVLRVDDRGVGKSTGDLGRANCSDLAADVLRGVAWLKGRKEIDPGRIGLIGHSEGGLVASMAASRSGDVRFLVMLAGPGLPGDELARLQAASLLKASGATDAQIASHVALLDQLFAVLKRGGEDRVIRESLERILATWLAGIGDQDRRSVGDERALIAARVAGLMTPRFRESLAHDPRSTLRRLRCPVLALGAGNDLQVPSGENLRGIEAALRAGGNPDFTVKAVPGLNHLFQTSASGSPNEYATLEETIAPAALEEIGRWIETRTGPIRGEDVGR
jgi:uncharacterized protein